jgi:hypothetical protein
MTSERRTERELSALLTDLYVESAPSYRFDVLAQTSRMRQRPRWTFPERWIPTALVRRHVRAPELAMRPVLILAALLLAILGLIALQAATRAPTPPPFGIARNGEIVYAVGGDIFVRDTVDSPRRMLIGGPDKDWGPWFSRRGDKFIFFRETVPDTYDIYVAKADGSDVRRLGGPFMDIDTWDVTPDGGQAMVTGRAEHSGKWLMQFYPLDGGPSRVLDLPDSATWARFRPGDGNWLSFRSGDPDAEGTMSMVRIDGTGLHPLDLAIDGVGGMHDFTHGMDWSVDGTQFAFVSVEKDTLDGGGLRIDIATVSPDGVVTGQRRVEFDPTADNELNPVFLPGTDKLLYNTREGIVDFVSIGTPGIPGGTIIPAGSTKEEGIDYIISPDAKTALVLNWGEKKTYLYDFATLQAREVDLSPDDVSAFQRRAP